MQNGCSNTTEKTTRIIKKQTQNILNVKYNNK